MHGAMPDEAPLWTIDRVSLGPGRLREVSVTIRRGVTAVLGWSGAGKTSLLNLLVGFEKPERGIIAGPRSVFWVPQNGGLWPHCTVRAHLAIVRNTPEENDEVLVALDLIEKADARPDELSGGERARLAVARALVSNAEVLVMDEPLVSIDPARAGRFWRVIRHHLSATGAALVFATHDPERVLGEAEQVICLRQGALLHAGEVGTLYSDPPSRELMECLGAGNWMTPEEAELWLDAPGERARCFRPEQIEIEPANISHVLVRAVKFRGAIAEVELHHLNAAVSRQFVHRPSGPTLQPGLPAAIRLRH